MGVCCIVFDIDGMLFEFFMNFLDIDFFFNISCFIRILCYFLVMDVVAWTKSHQ